MSMNSFLDDLTVAMNGDDNLAWTENGAAAYKSTGSLVLDFFANGGALRVRDGSSVAAVFERAYSEDPLLATKAMFYFRDIRGGQGERKTFRTLLAYCAVKHTEALRPNLALIPEYGRWDDLYALVDTPLEDEIWPLIDVQLAEDAATDKPSLLAKWLPSENASSKVTKRLARKTRQALNMDARTYRKLLSHIRRNIGLVEQTISNNEWGAIQYDKLPSKAGMMYRKAFYRHDAERYAEFLGAVKRGEKKINAGTLYPYEIVEKTKAYRGYGGVAGNEAASLDAMWNALPDYFGDEASSGIVVADVSGSMYGRPIEVSISLAIYTAERNKGPFHNKFITFSARPTVQTVEGKDIVEKVRNLSNAHWEMNTNIEAVFDLILDTAVRTGATQEDLPSHLYIVSDMEFDSSYVGGRNMNERLFQTIEGKYKAQGFNMPRLVFWNVNSRNDQQPVTMNDRGVQLVSGCSPSIFSSLLSNKTVSAYDLMLEVLNQDRYAAVRVGE